MPQLDQLSDVLYSQLFWLLLTLAIIYFAIGRTMVPKIQATVDARSTRISDDLAAAEAARRAADQTEEAYRSRMAESRAEALRLTGAAKQEGAAATATRVAEADAVNRAKVDAAAARVYDAAQAAMADLENVAAEAAQDMVHRLAGVTVSKADAAKAVKVVRANG